MDQSLNVVHVGFSKCASTFLRSFFNQHPATFLVTEAHYFVPFEHCHYRKGTGYYDSLFQGASPDQIKVESDEHIVLPLLHPVLRAAATTVDSVAQASARLKSTVTNPKIILVIRNQTDLMISRYGEYIMGGRDVDFDAFVTEFLASSKDGINYYQNYYSKIIDVFCRDFSPRNVLVLLQEELFADEARTIARLCDFLGVDPIQSVREKATFMGRALSAVNFRAVARSGRNSKNTGLSFLGIKVMRLWNRVVVIEPEEAYYKKVVAKVPYPLYKNVVRGIRLVDYYLPRRLKGNKKALLSEGIVNQIDKMFKDDNKRLADLLSKDLTALGY